VSEGEVRKKKQRESESKRTSGGREEL